MGIKKLTYLDIPASQRSARANAARLQVKQVLASPLATEEQKTAARERLGILTQWENGTLDAAPSASRAPRNHEVSVTEGVSVKEN